MSQTQRARAIVLLSASMLSLASLFYFYKTGTSNLYGDGMAHLNIARKMVDLDSDSLWTRYIQLGSPWLPLPHLLALPFVWNDFLWRTGLAGSLVSMVCYILAAFCVFEIGAICGGAMLDDNAGDKDVRSGFLAAAIFALNPSVLYLQATPMTELPFLACVAAAVLLLMRWMLDDRPIKLIIAGLGMAAALLTRYEAWAIAPAAAFLVFWGARGNLKERLIASTLWSVTAGTAVVYWLWHNWAIYGNPIEFLTGFYSSRNYFLRLQEKLGWADFAVGNVVYASLLAMSALAACAGVAVCLIFFLSAFKSIRLGWTQWREGKREALLTAASLLLAAPFVFCIYSLYNGNTQIYPLSALSLLNVRYGLSAMLACAVLSIILLRGSKPKVRLLILVSIVFLQYAWLVSDGPEQLAVVQEPYRNVHKTREARAYKMLENYLRSSPPAGKILMYSGEFVRTIVESDLKFQDLFFEGLGQWHEFKEEIPPQVQTVMVKEGDQLWKRLEGMDRFRRDFELVYSVEPSPHLMVWRRRESGVGSRE